MDLSLLLKHNHSYRVANDLLLVILGQKAEIFTYFFENKLLFVDCGDYDCWVFIEKKRVIYFVHILFSQKAKIRKTFVLVLALLF